MPLPGVVTVGTVLSGTVLPGTVLSGTVLSAPVGIGPAPVGITIPAAEQREPFRDGDVEPDGDERGERDEHHHDHEYLQDERQPGHPQFDAVPPAHYRVHVASVDTGSRCAATGRAQA